MHPKHSTGPTAPIRRQRKRRIVCHDYYAPPKKMELITMSLNSQPIASWDEGGAGNKMFFEGCSCLSSAKGAE